MFEVFGSIEQWIDDKMNELNQSIIFGGLPETAHSLLDKHMVRCVKKMAKLKVVLNQLFIGLV